MQIYIRTDEQGFVTMAMPESVELPDGKTLHQNVEGMTAVEWDKDITAIHDYRLVDGELILDETRKTEREEAAAAEQKAQQQRQEVFDNLPETLADTDQAVCELYETTQAQDATIAEQDAAICELYEMITPSEEVDNG